MSITGLSRSALPQVSRHHADRTTVCMPIHYVYACNCRVLAGIYDGVVPARPVRLFRQLLRVHRDVFLSVLHGRQGGRDDRTLVLRSLAAVHLLSVDQRLLSVLRPHRHPQVEEHRRLVDRRLLRALVLHAVRPVPGGPRNRCDGFYRHGRRQSGDGSCLAP